eukprot:IDg23127t1
MLCASVRVAALKESELSGIVVRKADAFRHSSGGLRLRVDRRKPFELGAMQEEKAGSLQIDPHQALLLALGCQAWHNGILIPYHQGFRGAAIQGSRAWSVELVPAFASKYADVGDVWLLTQPQVIKCCIGWDASTCYTVSDVSSSDKRISPELLG